VQGESCKAELVFEKFHQRLALVDVVDEDKDFTTLETLPDVVL
jgi:hypothetical protein